jgi:hypothetical protein
MKPAPPVTKARIEMTNGRIRIREMVHELVLGRA